MCLVDEAASCRGMHSTGAYIIMLSGTMARDLCAIVQLSALLLLLDVLLDAHEAS